MILSRFASNAAKSLGVGLFAVLPALVLPAALARLLPSPDLAAWLYAFTIGTYVLSFHLGVGPATSTLVARVAADPVARASFLLSAIGLTVMAALLATTVLLTASHFGVFDANAEASLSLGQFHQTLALTVIGTSLTLPLQAYYAYCTGVFDVGRFVPINLLQKLSMITFIVLAAWFVGDARSVGLAYVASAVLSLVVCSRLILRDLAPGRGRLGAQLLSRTRTLLLYSIPAALSGLAIIPLSGAHAVIVAREAPMSIIAFTALLPVLALIGGMTWSILGNMLSEFSAGFGASMDGGPSDRDKGTLAPQSLGVIERSTAFLGLGLGAIQVAVCAGLPILLFWMTGKDWPIDQVAALAAYCCVYLLRLQILPMNLGFYALGRPWLGQIPTWTEALLSITLVWLLSPRWGIAGIALGSAAALLVNALISSFLLVARGRTGASPWPLLRFMIVAMLSSGLLVGVIFFVAGNSSGPATYPFYVGSVAVAGAVTLALYWFIGLARDHAREARLLVGRFRARLGGGADHA